jgi:hypothetical protein
VLGLVAAVLSLSGLWTYFSEDMWAASPLLTVLVFVAIWVGYVSVLIPCSMGANRQLRQLRAQQKQTPSPSTKPSVRPRFWPQYEYRSSRTLLGLPLVHIRAGRGDEEKLKPAVGWIACGDYAIGALFASGGAAIAPLSVGGLSLGCVAFGGATIGLVAVGGAALGVLAGGGLAVGWWAMGGLAIGNYAFAGCAVAWEAAAGGAAVAKHFAVGSAASALHANDAAARAFMQDSIFFKVAKDSLLGSGWFFLLCWSPLLVLGWPTWLAWKTLRQKTEKA